MAGGREKIGGGGEEEEEAHPEREERKESGRVGDVADASPRYGSTLFCRRLLGISTKGLSVSDVNDVTKAGRDRSRWSDSPLTRGDCSRWHLRVDCLKLNADYCGLYRVFRSRTKLLILGLLSKKRERNSQDGQ